MRRNMTVLTIILSTLFAIIIMGMFGPPDSITDNAVFGLIGFAGGALTLLKWDKEKTDDAD